MITSQLLSLSSIWKDDEHDAFQKGREAYNKKQFNPYPDWHKNYEHFNNGYETERKFQEKKKPKK